MAKKKSSADQQERQLNAQKQKIAGENVFQSAAHFAGSVAKGAANAVVSGLESQQATFVNPIINAVGRATGHNPNLRQAGPMESAVNTVGALTDIVAPGAIANYYAGKAAASTDAAISNLGRKMAQNAARDIEREQTLRVAEQQAANRLWSEHPAMVAKRASDMQFTNNALAAKMAAEEELKYVAFRNAERTRRAVQREMYVEGIRFKK